MVLSVLSWVIYDYIDIFVWKDLEISWTQNWQRDTKSPKQRNIHTTTIHSNLCILTGIST